MLKILSDSSMVMAPESMKADAVHEGPSATFCLMRTRTTLRVDQHVVAADLADHTIIADDNQAPVRGAEEDSRDFINSQVLADDAPTVRDHVAADMRPGRLS